MLLPNSSFLIQLFLLLGCHTARSNFPFLFCLFVCFLTFFFFCNSVILTYWFFQLAAILYFYILFCFDAQIFLVCLVDEILPDLILLSQFFGGFLTCPFCTPLNSLRNSFLGETRKYLRLNLFFLILHTHQLPISPRIPSSH